MPEGGDLFNPARLRKLWERPEEDAFEKREREEKELQETEPTLVALDLYDQIVRTCRRNLAGRAHALAPLLKHTRGLLAMKLAADRAEAAPAAPPAAEAPAAPAPGDKPKTAAPKGPEGRVERLTNETLGATLSDENRADRRVKRDLARAFKLAGLDKKSVENPKAQPAELGAALDAIEDLYETLAYDGAGGAGAGAGLAEAATERGVNMLRSKGGSAAELAVDNAQEFVEGSEFMNEMGLGGMGEGSV